MVDGQGTVTSLLSHAREQERLYDWLGAAESYKSALEALPKEDLIGIGQIEEASAYALFRGAMQAENIEEFRSRLNETEREYGNAKESYSRASSPAHSPRVSRCEAMIAYLGFWQTPDVATKKKKVSESWSHAKRAMDAFGHEEVSEFGKTYNELFLSAVFCLHFSDNQDFRKTMLSEAITYGERVITLLSDARDLDELVKALIKVAGLHAAVGRMSVASAGEQEKEIQRTVERWRRAVSLSEETALAEKAYAEFVYELTDLADMKDLQQIAEKQLAIARKTRDCFAIGVTLGFLAFFSQWQAAGMEDPADANALLQKSLRYVEEAGRQFGNIGFVTPDYFSAAWTSSPSQPWYYDTQARLETDLRRKGELARKSLESARLEFVAAKESGYPCVVEGSHHAMGNALVGLAGTEVDKEGKARLLEEAIQHRIECSRLGDILMPSLFWDRAVLRCVLGETELEYAEIASGNEARATCLASSASHLREGLQLFETQFSIPSFAIFLDAGNFTRLSKSWRNYGRALQGSSALTGVRETGVQSAMAFDKAAEFDGKAGMPSRVAESLWEAARTYDGLGEHLKASERFEEASQQYGKAAEKIKSLSSLYKDQSLYMKAWSEIEQAKYRHARQEPSMAKECFKKAAERHESTVKWNFLSTSYFAWAELENAEDLSQRERSRESIEAFRKTADLFKDSKIVMLEQLSKIDSSAEKQMVERLIEAADQRRELCRARIILEEARQLDKEGDLSSASERYELAAEVFARISQGIPAEQDRREIDLIITLSRAWKAMAKAEAQSSPELYEEATHLFDEAKNLSPGDKAKNLTLGHSRLCMALAAGAKYADTFDAALHTAATQNLESAANYYLKAGLQSAAEYAKASRLLFDGYVYMNKASSEENHEKKTKLYSLAEKVLQASASSYGKAGQSGRKEQVLKLLAKVKEDRELAMSLAEVFLAPDIVSTTRAFSSPTATHETAVGLDRFENADVQATLIARPQELHVGQELSLEIELVNAGRGAAQLTKVEEIVPKGFMVVQEPDKYRIEDRHINLRGRRLDALKTEDVRLVLKSTAKGNFRLTPRIVYLDESGADRSCEPAAVEVAVREMGISGWLKGK